MSYSVCVCAWVCARDGALYLLSIERRQTGVSISKMWPETYGVLQQSHSFFILSLGPD